jgi:APA family basic amino acid/polyamine antiporter
VSALFHLRRTQPNLPRPYKAWGYPVLPLCFIATVLWMVVNEMRQDFVSALGGFAMMAACVPFYFSIRKKSGI